MPKEPRPLHDLHPLRLLPLVLCLVMVVFCIIRGGFSVEDILSYAPRNVWLAAGFLLLLYLAKSLSVAFPIIVLQVAAGHLFAPAAALALNVLGLAVDLTVPFWIGRFSGRGLTTRLLARYPRLDGLLESQEGHYLFLSFFLRVIYLLPGDIVSMYFGSVRDPISPVCSAGCWAACPACWPPPCWAPAFHSLVPRPFGSPLASPPGFPSSRCWAISFGKGVKRTKSNPTPNRIPLRRGRSFPTPCLEHPRHHCLAPALSSPDYPPWLKRKK